MSNSSLVSYTKISPNKTARAYRNASSTGKISKITIHHMAGCISVESCGSWFAQSSAKCSSNYGIDSTGKIALYVPEDYRSWCSSNGDNDNIAVTIEIANSASGNPWPVSDKALAACIDLCVDICQRNSIEKLVYTGTTSGNLTRHDMFCNKVCPGPYLGGKFPYIVEQVNAKLGKPIEITADSVKPNLQYGDDNSYVSKCQELLMRLGYSIGVSAPTGYFGSNTLAAIKLFQSANKLEVDGIVGPKTWAALFSDSAVKYVASATTESSTASATTVAKADSGSKASTVVNIALGEIGYKEKATNASLDLTTANAGSNNWTKYARDLYNAGYYNGNKNGYAWCDVFVDWCFYKAFGKTEGQLMEYQTGTLGAACPYSAGYYKAKGRYDTTPKYGDQVFFQQNGALVHTGLVVGVTSSTVTVVEGNKSNMVQKITYSRSNSYIAGYGHPNYDTIDAPSSSGSSGSSSSATSSSGNSNIKAFQTWLNSNFGTGLSVDGVYGPMTKKAAIKAFQSSMNSIYGKSLSVDGIFGAKSKASLSSVALKYGATGNLVRVLQGMLYCLGYNPNGFDGIFGNGTKSAVTSFQKAKGLTQDSIAGQATFTALFA